jgi:hypothetical protein
MKSPLTIPLTNEVLSSIVAAYLQSISVIPDEADIAKIEFSDLAKDKVSLTIHFKREEVDVIYF